MTEVQTYSAKQVARRIGTDAKTFRKWLRSAASPYDAVGQGGRYEFPKTDLPEIDKKFHAWKDRSPNGKVPPRKVTTTRIPTQTEIADAIDRKKIEELEEREPTFDDLEDLEELDLDLEDLE